MGYAERFLLGIVIVLSAYSLYNNSQSRHQIHTITTFLKDYICSCLGCYCWAETARLGLVVLVFTGGFNLIIDSSILAGLIAQSLILAIQAFELKDGCFCLPKVQSLILNLCIFIFLLKDLSEQWQNDKKNAAQRQKAEKNEQQSVEQVSRKTSEIKRQQADQKGNKSSKKSKK